MRRTVLAPVVLAVALLATACSSSAPSSAPPTDGCTKTTSQEMYQDGMYECPDGTIVFTFATETARDNWIDTATRLGTGTTVLSKGATWARVKEAG